MVCRFQGTCPFPLSFPMYYHTFIYKMSILSLVTVKSTVKSLSHSCIYILFQPNERKLIHQYFLICTAINMKLDSTLGSKFCHQNHDWKKEERTRNIAAQKKYPVPFFPPRNCVYRWNLFPGKSERFMCRRERNENSNKIAIIFFILPFSHKKDTLMDNDHKCMYVCLCVFIKFYCIKP